MKKILTVFLIVLALPLAALATDYYVDPDYAGGTRNGNAATPWQSLSDTVTNTPWTVIDTALASGSVAVYFSARTASADTNQTTTTTINITRTDTSTNVLTLNANSKYNTSDVAPSWSAYSGLSKFQITGVRPIDSNNSSTPWTKRNYITIQGFRTISTNQGLVFEGMSHLVVDSVEYSASAGTEGPGLITGRRNSDTIGPYATNITIQNSYGHNTYGECIYVDGSRGTGVPPGEHNETTNDTILITGNTLTDCGTVGGQGDAIDVKDGNTNVTISNNAIDVAGSPNVGAPRCITIESGALIDANFCKPPTYGTTFAATSAYTNSFGRDGLTVRNNILIAGPGIALKLDASDGGGAWTNANVLNNTILKPVGTTDHVVLLDTFTGVTFTNNIVIGLDTYQCLRYNFGTVTFASHDYNSYTNATSNFSWVTGFNGGTSYDKADIGGSWETHSITTAQLLVSTTAPYLAANFKLASVASPPYNAGTTIGSFSTDYFGTTRPQASIWDIGANEFAVSTGASGVGRLRRK